MSLLGGLGGWLRNKIDDAGSVVTGQPAHSPAPPAPQPHQPITLAPPPPPGVLSVANQPNHQQIGLPQPTDPNHAPTWSLPQSHPNLFHQGINLGHHLVNADMDIVNTGRNMAKGLEQGVGGLVKTGVIAPGVSTLANFSHDPYVKQAAQQYQSNADNQTAPFIHQAITRPIAEAAGTILHPSQQFSFHPNSPIEQAVFGHTPVQNINANVATNYDTHKNLNPALRIGLAGADAAGQIAQMAPVAGGSLKLLKGAGAKVILPVRPTNLSDAELGALAKYHSQMGNGNLMDDATYHNGVAAANKVGVSHTDPNAISNVLGAHRNYITQLANRQAQLSAINQKLGVGHLGLSTKDVTPDFLKPTNPQTSPNAVDPLAPHSLDVSAKPENPSVAGKPSLANQLRLAKAPQLPIRIQSKAGSLSKETKLLQIQEKDTPKPSASANYTTNPTEVKIPEVAPGDYGKARSNAQLASAPIEYSAGQVARSARSLKMTTSRLGRLVEGTDKPINAKEVEAVNRYKQLADRIHATSQALGGNTPYRNDYFHHEWDLSKPGDAAKFEAFRQRKFGEELDPSQFQGLDTQPRVFDTVAQGEAAGFKLKNPDAANEVLDYAKGSASALKRQALSKGFLEADSTAEDKPHSFDMGQGQTLALSDKGLQEIRAFDKTPQAGQPLKIYRGANRKLKQTLLSASEFHPINITKKAAPALAIEGHPVLAAKGAYSAARAQFGRRYSDKLQQSFLDDGTVDAAARIGTPIKFGSDYETEGQLNLGHAGIGEKTIFEKSMPALHGRMVQGVVQDLQKEGISLDSPEARAAGTRINEIMGFVNTEVRNLDKGHQKFLGDVALAPQFTRAKWATIKAALHDKGVAGSYARSAVLGDTLATAAVMLGLGYLAKQKSDSIKDTVIRAILRPSVPTPFKDSKGNTEDWKMPSTYTSEALGLVANITRNKDGHLGITFKPSNLPSNLANYGRARLAILPGAGLKLKTNTDYAGKPLYDPNAPAGTKAQQAATTILGGTLPIGTQGVLETNAVKRHLPEGVQQVLTANTPGSNPLLKSVGSAFGLTPETDKTVGKGLQTAQYFSALDQAKSGLNRQEKDAIDYYSGSKKNPVTGAYDIQPTVDDQRTRATQLLSNPKVIDHLMTMNKKLSADGQNVDPLWQQPKDRIVKYLQYQAMPPGGPDQVNWRNTNPWYNQGNNSLASQRDAFFNSLPPGDPNKPKAPIEYPTPDTQTTSDMNTYFAMTDPTQKADFLTSHPNVSDQFDKQADYNNALRVSQGYGALRTYPKPNEHVQAILDGMPQGTDAASRKARAIAYQDPEVAAWSQEDAIYNLTKGAGLAQIQGNSLTSKDLKATQSLQYDILKNPDGTLSLMYGDSQGGAGATPTQAGATGISGSSYKSKTKAPFSPLKRYRKLYIRHAKKPRIYLKKPPSPIKVKNKANQHVGIKSKTYL